MNGYNAVTLRKSTRRYRPDSLSDPLLNTIKELPAALTPLYKNTGICFDILPRKAYEEAYKKISVKAPYYLAITSRPEQGYLENAGYMGEQFVLALTQEGLGTCWMGTAQQTANTLNGSYCISIAFGKMALGEQFRRSANDFQRKKISDYILSGSDNCNSKLLDLVQAARLAPSAINGQPIRYLIQGNKIHVYRKSAFLNSKLIGTSMQRIDAGIALANMMTASAALRTSISFRKDTDAPALRALTYVTTAHVTFLPPADSLL